MKKIIAVLAVLFSVSSAQAADKQFSIAGLIGYGVGEDSFSGLTYGAEFDYMFDPSWSAGLYWTMTKKSDYPTAGVDTTFMPIMLHVNYHFADMQGFYVGPRLGLASSKASSGGLSVSSSDFTIGAQTGYDFDIATDWSIGVQANWNYVLADDAGGVFNFVAPIKYHF